MSYSIEPTSKTQLSFIFIYGGQLFSFIGSAIVSFAIVWWITDTTKSTSFISIANTITLIPYIVILPIAGVYSDLWDRKRTIIISDSLQSLSTLIIFILLFIIETPNPWFFVAMNGLRNIFQSFHAPAMNAIIPLMVPKDNLSRMNSLRMFLSRIVGIVSPIIAGFLIIFIPIQYLLLIDLITFLIAIIPIIFIPIPKMIDDEENPKKKRFFNELIEGLKTVRSNKSLILMGIWSLLLMFVSYPRFIYLPYLINVYHNGIAFYYSLVVVCGQIGYLVGGLLLSIKKKWKNITSSIIFFTFFQSLAGLGMFLVPFQGFWIIGLFNFIASIMHACVISLYNTFIHKAVEPDKLGRIYSLDMFLSYLVVPISTGISGPITKHFNIIQFLIGCSILEIFFNCVMYFAGIRNLNKISENSPENENKFLGTHEAINEN